MCLGLLALFPSPGLSPCSGELLANAETLHRVLARAEVWAPREPSQEHVPDEGAGSVRPRTPRSPPRRSHTRHKRESQLTETGEPPSQPTQPQDGAGTSLHTHTPGPRESLSESPVPAGPLQAPPWAEGPRPAPEEAGRGGAGGLGRPGGQGRGWAAPRLVNAPDGPASV